MSSIKAMKGCASNTHIDAYESTKLFHMIDAYMEKEIPSSFFNLTVHLIIQLVEEFFICGSILVKWMYPFERS